VKTLPKYTFSVQSFSDNPFRSARFLAEPDWLTADTPITRDVCKLVDRRRAVFRGGGESREEFEFSPVGNHGAD